MAKIDLIFRNKTRYPQWRAGFFNEVIKTALAVLKRSAISDQRNRSLSLSVNLVSETEIRGLNKKYRGKDKPTNVLSFPLQDKLIGDKRFAIGDLGDIFICLSIAKKEAKEENISVNRKLAWLTIHGFLHLLGYEHEKSRQDMQRMLDLEERILSHIEF